DRSEDGPGPHHHARSSAERVVVDLPVPALGMVSDVVHPDPYQSAANGPPQQALSQGAVEDRREQGEDVDPHPIRVRGHGAVSPETSLTTTRRAERSTSATTSFRAGTRTSPSSPRTTHTSLAGVVITSTRDPSDRPRSVTTSDPTRSWV